ncbi:metacaspase-1 isoform X2 isoform B [Micractinium conductrix]|uniref:Metacaspase-1 isoform X2 isoform B n=1 Tax=Micractinium conductrix TaxID=554055 RepID=A0A2P6VI22_9CHLO|nr:metacaspase-1 isoform X2 isoform B [Micractinium conductrix]|eukprot:PSC73732.1 metacaspase-1 isoform X2 isoform B [Micractinium conductrix]
MALAMALRIIALALLVALACPRNVVDAHSTALWPVYLDRTFGLCTPCVRCPHKLGWASCTSDGYCKSCRLEDGYRLQGGECVKTPCPYPVECKTNPCKGKRCADDEKCMVGNCGSCKAVCVPSFSDGTASSAIRLPTMNEAVVNGAASVQQAAMADQPREARPAVDPQQQQQQGDPPPAVPLGTQFPVEGLMGAVDAIKQHHDQEVAEHKCTEAAAAAAAAPAAQPDGSDAAGQPGGKPLGYPGTFYLEKPLTGDAANTLIRMWPPNYGGAPGYPPAGAPGYPPAGAPGYPPAGAPGYPPASAPPPGAAPAASSAYPQVHHTGGGAPPANGRASGGAPSAPPYTAAPVHAAQHAPSAPAPGMPPAGGSGRKKAFIVGINYFGTSAQLRGCINDAKCMEYLLKTKFGFKQENILMMTDDCPDPMRRPTKANMHQGFRWLMMDLKPGDSLVFHYSGHGSQQRDYSGEETDGMNETLCPMDFKYAGEIVDDELNRMLINPLPKGVKLHAIIDACHSGSVMDLPYQAHVRGGYAAWEASYHYTRSHKGTAGGFAVQFGASKDSQTAADTQALAGNTSTGAATFCFIQAIERHGTKLTYGELLLAMHNTLQATMGQASQGSSGGGGLLGMLLGGGGMTGGGYRGQEPVMSANYAFDMAYPFSI